MSDIGAVTKATYRRLSNSDASIINCPQLGTNYEWIVRSMRTITRVNEQAATHLIPLDLLCQTPPNHCCFSSLFEDLEKICKIDITSRIPTTNNLSLTTNKYRQHGPRETTVGANQWRGKWSLTRSQPIWFWQVFATSSTPKSGSIWLDCNRSHDYHK